MKEWILENTNIPEEEYDKLISSKTLHIEGESKPINTEQNKIFEHPILTIDQFTLQKPTIKSKLKYQIKTYKQGFIHKKIKFVILATILKEMEDILYSNNRKRKCFELSLEILKNYSGTYIVTLLCIDPQFKEPIPFLHAVTLTKDNEGNELIFDTTYNVIMKKETYLKILNATIISIISREEFSKDITLIKDFLKKGYIYLDEYLCFREQTISAVKKLSKTKQ